MVIHFDDDMMLSALTMPVILILSIQESKGDDGFDERSSKRKGVGRGERRIIKWTNDHVKATTNGNTDALNSFINSRVAITWISDDGWK